MLSWWTPEQEYVQELEIDDSAPNFLDAVADEVERLGFDASRIALWREWPDDTSIAAILTLERNDRVDGPVFIARDVSTAEVAAFSTAYGLGHRLWLRANEGVGGDDIWSFVVGAHESLQVVFEFAAYFQVIRYIWLAPRRAKDEGIKNEIRIEVQCRAVSEKLRSFLRSRESWTSRELEKEFHLSFESVSEILTRCGFSPRGDRVGLDVVWYRDLDDEGHID